jgi:hypothetical protein
MDEGSGKSAAERLVERLEQQVAEQRAEGAYQDDLSGIELETRALDQHGRNDLAAGFDLGATGPRVRFRPELGFSSKPVIGPVITGVKRFYLRMLFYVFDDLAQQTDAALARLEAALFVEVASRERLEGEVRELKAQLDRMRPDEKPGDRP